MFTEWDDSDIANETMQLIARTEERSCVVALKTTPNGSAVEDFDAITQLCHDELGDPNAIYSAGDVFEIVAVPDDVAHAGPDSDGVLVIIGPLCDAGLREELETACEASEPY